VKVDPEETLDRDMSAVKTTVHGRGSDSEYESNLKSQKSMREQNSSPVEADRDLETTHSLTLHA
jgi:hypothetical protein